MNEYICGGIRAVQYSRDVSLCTHRRSNGIENAELLLVDYYYSHALPTAGWKRGIISSVRITQPKDIMREGITVQCYEVGQ